MSKNPLIAKGRGTHPNSLANIGGAPQIYDTPKKARSLWVTDLAWNELDKLAKQLDISRPEIIERIARGVYKIDLNPEPTDPNEVQEITITQKKLNCVK